MLLADTAQRWLIPAPHLSFLVQAKCPLTEDELAEARVRLVVGFKRYFHGKRLEGLLSSRVMAMPSMT